MAYRRRGFDDRRRSDDEDHPANGRRSPSWEGHARKSQRTEERDGFDIDDRRRRRDDDREECRSEDRDRDDRRPRNDRDRDRSRSRSKDRERRHRRSSEYDDEDRDHSDRERHRGSPGDRPARDRSGRRRRDDRSSRERSRSPGRGDRHIAGEWYCHCGALNFKRRTTCFRQFCGAQRSEAPPPGAPVPNTYTAEDIPALAAYSAQLYATTPQKRAQYLTYYTNYYTRQLVACPSEADKVNEAAAVAHSAISQVQARAAPVSVAASSSAVIQTPTPQEMPTGLDNRIYRVPDTSTYIYDPSSGFYYDPSTGLYYDANTQYYYNSQSGQYLYWDASRMTYFLAATAESTPAASVAAPVAPAPTPTIERPEEPKKPVEKQDKVKVAKKIAKDMERWARTLNHKKEAARAGATAEAAAAAGVPSGSADIGFTVLEARPSAPAPIIPVAPPLALVPSYGAGSDSSGDEDETIVDRLKLACLLCKRQFPSAEVLDKHVEMSDLHRKNLEEWKKRAGERGETSDSYRDRAAERRMKYGEEEPPVVQKRKSGQGRASGAGSASDASLPPREIGEDNVGKKLLKKMGWSAGQGLGRDGSGRVLPVEARPNHAGVGLGQKRSIYTAVVGETYRSCVRKLTVARYQDLLSTEDNP